MRMRVTPAAVVLSIVVAASGAASEHDSDLDELSLEQLMNVPIV